MAMKIYFKSPKEVEGILIQITYRRKRKKNCSQAYVKLKARSENYKILKKKNAYGGISLLLHPLRSFCLLFSLFDDFKLDCPLNKNLGEYPKAKLVFKF